MAVGLKSLAKLHPVSGVKIGVAQAGIKYENRNDLTLFSLCEGANVASVFTKNRFCAAPVIVAKENLAVSSPRYLLVNTGNANAGTGPAGKRVSVDCCNGVASIAGCKADQVLPFSTGVIGELLDESKIINALPAAFKNLNDDNWAVAAKAIMTTDTLPKGCSAQIELDGEIVTITGISKGSGMIRPDMATMLAYVATDAEIDAVLLQSLLNKSNRVSFNAITVDGDTSTNDACILMATGKSKVRLDESSSEELLATFYQALESIMQQLAQSIIRDGEGATKFITVLVEGGVDTHECEQVAYTIAHSPLVKTAFFASDPNWGRILAAVGRAGIDDLDIEKLTIKLNDVVIVEGGDRAASYSEEKGQAVMNQEEICISVNLARGVALHTVWTCDLSYDYVKINAEYRS
ncbi:MAG: bifunctional glutamate N-acetyltransferase/amino-acid acetyltransferase ArgJ [Gammaproteobacteria bacterium]|nr:bifunctional glutamate N-acetyltransferase/amino-acid acetyltransferase ArgJ [Gammaproteobacteria bacterium]